MAPRGPAAGLPPLSAYFGNARVSVTRVRQDRTNEKAPLSGARLNLRKDPEARLAHRQLPELRVDAPEVVLPPLVARLHLDPAHRQRPPARPHRTELAPLLRLEHQCEVDLHVEHLLHAPDVGPPHFLERIEERATPRDAGRRIDDLVAVDSAATALD